MSDYHSPLSPKIESLFPGAKSMVVMAYKELSNCESDSERIATTGRLDIMEFSRSCNYKLARFIEREFKDAKAMSTSVSYPMNLSKESRYGLVADFSQRHAAIAAGLGSFGRHNLVIHPKLGTRAIFTTVLCSLDLPPDPPVTEDLCTHCNICVDNCPGGALNEEGKTDALVCLKHSQPYGMGAIMGFWKNFIDSSPEEQKKMISSNNYMSFYQAQMIGYQYFCFKCAMLCPVNQ